MDNNYQGGKPRRKIQYCIYYIAMENPHVYVYIYILIKIY